MKSQPTASFQLSLYVFWNSFQTNLNKSTYTKLNQSSSHIVNSHNLKLRCIQSPNVYCGALTSHFEALSESTMKMLQGQKSFCRCELKNHLVIGWHQVNASHIPPSTSEGGKISILKICIILQTWVILVKEVLSKSTFLILLNTLSRYAKYSQICQICQILNLGGVFWRAKDGQVWYPWEDLAKCSLDALTLCQ